MSRLIMHDHTIKESHAVTARTNILLTAIVPVGNMNGNLTLLSGWLNKISKFPLRVIIVHDEQDSQTSIELKKIVNEFRGLEVIKISGTFGCPGLARNAGIALLNSPWVAFWDCDDEPILENIFNAIQNATEAEILVGGFIAEVAYNNNFEKKQSDTPTLQSVSFNPGLWRMIFRSHLVCNVEFTKLKLAEDQVFLSEINFVEKRKEFIDLPFYEYKLGAPNQLTKDLSNLRDLILASEIIFRKTNKYLLRETIVFNLTLVLRQQMTLLKLGDTNLRMNSLNLLYRYFVNANFKLHILLLVAIYNVLWAFGKSKLK